MLWSFADLAGLSALESRLSDGYLDLCPEQSPCVLSHLQTGVYMLMYVRCHCWGNLTECINLQGLATHLGGGGGGEGGE